MAGVRQKYLSSVLEAFWMVAAVVQILIIRDITRPIAFGGYLSGDPLPTERNGT